MTAAVMPSVRVTVTASLSTLPLEIVNVVASPLILPLVALTGNTIANGAPIEATALN